MIEKREHGDTLFFGYCNPTTGKLEWKAENKDEYDYFTGNNLLLYIKCCLLLILYKNTFVNCNLRNVKSICLSHSKLRFNTFN